jgi:hypothetical protein
VRVCASVGPTTHVVVGSATRRLQTTPTPDAAVRSARRTALELTIRSRICLAFSAMASKAANRFLLNSPAVRRSAASCSSHRPHRRDGRALHRQLSRPIQRLARRSDPWLRSVKLHSSDASPQRPNSTLGRSARRYSPSPCDRRPLAVITFWRAANKSLPETIPFAMLLR